jgi:hypothetical protein
MQGPYQSNVLCLEQVTGKLHSRGGDAVDSDTQVPLLPFRWMHYVPPNFR